jgi:hypothetical protein
MTLEKGLIDGYILEPHNALVPLDFHNSVDQQERITMGEKAHDIHDAVDEALLHVGHCRKISHTSPSDSISALADAQPAFLFSLRSRRQRL